MKLKQLIAAAFGAALVAMPILAGAAEEGGTICGRVDVPSPVAFQLLDVPNQNNIVVARSQSEEVQTTVSIDGSYCFKDLHTDLHTIVAFEDALQTNRASVTPVAGQTLIVDLTAQTAGL